MQKTNLIFVLLFASIASLAQVNNNRGYNLPVDDSSSVQYPKESPWVVDSDFINSNNANNLIAHNKLFYIYEYGGDFLDTHCHDSLSFHKYHFESYYYFHGDVGLFPRVRDTIKAFDRIMDKAINKLNGTDWQKQLGVEDSLCQRCFCSLGDSFGYYMKWVYNRINYKKGQVQLSVKQRCIINKILVPILKEEDSLYIEIEGFSSKDEENRKRTISKQRAQNFAGYLIQQGIDSSNLKVKWYGATMPLTLGSGNYLNRRVEYRLIGQLKGTYHSLRNRNTKFCSC